MRTRCPACGRDVLLREDGKLRLHHDLTSGLCNMSARFPRITVDDRPEGERYVLYTLVGGDLQELAAAPDASGLGYAIVQLHEDGMTASGERLYERGPIGIRDAYERKWIVLPWRKGD